MTSTWIGKFRLMGIIEGISYLLLLGVAMPLKYYFGEVEDVAGKAVYANAIYVTVTGMAHGILFILYGLLLAIAMHRHKWSLGYGAYLLGAAFIPFGTFYTDRKLRELESQN
jgi:integral membrane protein|tara:strand:- start:518 stop:853 length:336 start_codon:yes stop_codon:yes gene_type:complete